MPLAGLESSQGSPGAGESTSRVAHVAFGRSQSSLAVTGGVSFSPSGPFHVAARDMAVDFLQSKRSERK